MSAIKLFESKQIRSIWDEKEQKWFFSVVDVVHALTDSPDPKDYWYRIKKRDKIQGVELSTNCRQLKLEAADGKKYLTDCSHAEGILRIIQSIPSPKAEPFKQWLAYGTGGTVLTSLLTQKKLKRLLVRVLRSGRFGGSGEVST